MRMILVDLSSAKRAFDYTRKLTYGVNKIELESYMEPYPSVLKSIIKVVDDTIQAGDMLDAEFDNMVSQYTMDAMEHQVIADVACTKAVVEEVLKAIYKAQPEEILNARIKVKKFSVNGMVVDFRDAHNILDDSMRMVLQ